MVYNVDPRSFMFAKMLLWHSSVNKTNSLLQVVRLTFTAFCTEIDNVYVGVYNGPTSSNPALMSTSGCVAIPGPVTTTQPSMFVLLYSNGGGLLFSGFSATYTMQ
jgi:hypothetical protein